MELTYGLSRDVLLRLLGLVFIDRGYGVRVVSVIDPAFIPYKNYSIVFTALKDYLAKAENLPDFDMLGQFIVQQRSSGAFDETVYRSVQKLVARILRAEPLTRDQAKLVLKDAVLESEVGLALDQALNLYKKRQYEDIDNLMRDAYSRVRLLDVGSVGCNMKHGLKEYLDRVEKGESHVDRIPVGIPALDKLIKGGLGRGELGCVLAPPKAGKSMMLCHIAQTAVLLGYHVVYITFELSEVEVMNRMASGLTGISIDAISYGGRDVCVELGEKLRDILSSSGGDYTVKQFPSKGAAVSDIDAYLRDIQRLWGCDIDVLVIDYADEVADSTSSASKVKASYISIGDIYSECRALGGSKDDSYSSKGGFDCAVWTASQPKVGPTAAVRSGDSDVFTLQDAAESYLKAAKLDCMVALCQDEDEISSSMFRLYYVGGRFAPGGRGRKDVVGPLVQDFEHGRLTDCGRFSVKEGKQWERKTVKKTTMETRIKKVWVEAPQLGSIGKTAI